MKGFIARFANWFCGTYFLWGWVKTELTQEERLNDARDVLRHEFMKHRVLPKEYEDFLGELASGCKDTAVHFRNRQLYILKHINHQQSPWMATYVLLAPYCNEETVYPEQELYLARQEIDSALEKGNSCLPYQKALSEALVARLPRMPKDIARAVASVVFFTCKEFHHKKSK